MKFNLKNRPKWNPYASETDKRELINRIFDWFEGFEKELRKNLEAYPMDKTQWRKGRISLIKEILGE